MKLKTGTYSFASMNTDYHLKLSHPSNNTFTNGATSISLETVIKTSYTKLDTRSHSNSLYAHSPSSPVSSRSSYA